MEELRNELLEIRGALNYGVLAGKIKNELYQNLIDKTEKALALLSVVKSLKETEEKPSGNNELLKTKLL